MVTHIFNAEMYHLSPDIIDGMMQFFKADQFRVILLGTDQVDKSRYISIFEKFNFTDFTFCSYKPSDISRLLFHYKLSAILFHGGTSTWWQAAIDAGCENVNWICWGGDAKWDTSRRKQQHILKRLIGSLYDRIMYHNRVKLYRHFNSIVALMEADKKSIVSQFEVNADKIYVIPYWSRRNTTFKHIIEDLINSPRPHLSNKPLVLLGNNPGNIPYYSALLDVLKRFSGRINLHCMLQYSLVKSDAYFALVEKGKSLFGNDFVTDEDFMSMDQYYPYMNTADVYICANPDQSGLGAISTMVLLGKKVYITGKNLEYVTGYGARVNDTSELGTVTYENLIAPVPQSVQINNRQAQETFLGKSVQAWKEYFRLIDPDYARNQ